MNWAWSIQLEPAPKLVLLALADTSDDQGRSWPSVGYIAAKACVSRRTVQRVLHQLESSPTPLLRVHQRRAENGRQRANMYQLLLDREGVNLAPHPQPGCGEGVTAGALPRAELRQGEDVTADTPEGDIAMSPLEPPDEPSSRTKKRTTMREAVDIPVSASDQRAIAQELLRLPTPMASKLMSQLAAGRRAGTIRAPAAWVKSAVDRLCDSGTEFRMRHQDRSDRWKQ
jgi:hypothetical protein